MPMKPDTTNSKKKLGVIHLIHPSSHPSNAWGANGCLTSLQTFFHLRVERVLLSLTREFSPVETSASLDVTAGMGASIWQKLHGAWAGGTVCRGGTCIHCCSPIHICWWSQERNASSGNSWAAGPKHPPKKKPVDALSDIRGVCAPDWLPQRRLATLFKQAWSVRPQPTFYLRGGWTARSRCVPSSVHG